MSSGLGSREQSRGKCWTNEVQPQQRRDLFRRLQEVRALVRSPQPKHARNPAGVAGSCQGACHPRKDVSEISFMMYTHACVTICLGAHGMPNRGSLEYVLIATTEVPVLKHAGYIGSGARYWKGCTPRSKSSLHR